MFCWRQRSDLLNKVFPPHLKKYLYSPASVESRGSKNLSGTLKRARGKGYF
jgi:hypothetical protein